MKNSTPTPFDEEIEAFASLSQLESALNVINTTETGLLELLPVSSMGQDASDAPQLQPEDDNVSSVCEFPELPRVTLKVHFLTDFSESEKTADEASLVSCPSLYVQIPIAFESGTEASDESGLHARATGVDRPSTWRGPSTKKPANDLPELSGRSPAILKTYFGEAKAFNLPQVQGHTTFAFIEPHM